MAEPISDPKYWETRLRTAPPNEIHQAIFRCPLDRWKRIEAKHREILQWFIAPDQSVFDVGCGYGRLLTLMPSDWRGSYMGVDLSIAFLEKAERDFPSGDKRRWFWCNLVSDYLVASPPGCPAMVKFDWAVIISFRPMIIRNLGKEAWQRAEQNIRRNASRLLYLEYDETDQGSLE